MDDQSPPVESAVRSAARAAKDAQPVLARLRRAEKDALLHAMARRGAVVLMSTHDPEVAETADAGVHLDDGRLG